MPVIVVIVVIVALSISLLVSTIGNTAVELATAQAQIEQAKAAQRAAESATVSAQVIGLLVVVVLIMMIVIMAVVLFRPRTESRHYGPAQLTRDELMQILDAYQGQGRLPVSNQYQLPAPRQMENHYQQRIRLLEMIDRI
jgi:beta-lactamase regulating signal transducer with metallopeptidase domain